MTAKKPSKPAGAAKKSAPGKPQSRVEQRSARRPHKPEVVGSSPTPASKVVASAAIQSIEERKHRFSLDLFDDVERLRLQLFARAIEYRTSVVSDGKDAGSSVVITRVELDEPTFRDKKTIIAAIAIALDQVLRLDSGEGSNVIKVLEVLESLRRAGPIDTGDEALGQLALTLARNLDEGAGMAAAAVSKELRATLAALAKESDEPDSSLFGDDLPTEVRDTQEP